MTKSLYDAWSGWLVVTLTGLASGKEKFSCNPFLVNRKMNRSPLLPTMFFSGPVAFLKVFILFQEIFLNIRLLEGRML